MKLTDQEFIEFWEKAKDRKEVAKVCETNGSCVGMRASKLRKLGHKLKLFPKGRTKTE
jgi:hypothetical protein